MSKRGGTEEVVSDFNDAEVARRRDEVVRRMANTPPQPRQNSKSRQMRKKKSAGAGRSPSEKSTDDC